MSRISLTAQHIVHHNNITSYHAQAHRRSTASKHRSARALLATCTYISHRIHIIHIPRSFSGGFLHYCIIGIGRRGVLHYHHTHTHTHTHTNKQTNKHTQTVKHL